MMLKKRFIQEIFSAEIKSGETGGFLMNIIFLIGALRFSGAENVLRCIAPSIASKGHNYNLERIISMLAFIQKQVEKEIIELN